MRLLPDQQRVKTLLSDTITLLCKNGLKYSSEFCIEALIGITVDQNQVFLVNINETIGKELLGKHSIKNRKRKIIENGSGLVNGDHISSNTGMSKNKNPRLHENTHKHSQHNVPSPSKDEVFLVNNRKSSESKVNASKVETIPSENDLPAATLSSNVLSPHNSEGDHDPKHNNNNDKNQDSVQVKQEPEETDQGNDSELAMQLLYGSEADDDNNKSDLSNVEHQVTGPPVWPEPTLSFSSGLTLPTVIAPSHPGGGDAESPTHSNEETSGPSSQVNLSQVCDGSRFGKSSIVVDDYKYYRDKVSTKLNTVYWKCADKKCKGRLIDRGIKGMLARGVHNHLPTQKNIEKIVMERLYKPNSPPNPATDNVPPPQAASMFGSVFPTPKEQISGPSPISPLEQFKILNPRFEYKNRDKSTESNRKEEQNVLESKTEKISPINSGSEDRNKEDPNSVLPPPLHYHGENKIRNMLLSTNPKDCYHNIEKKTSANIDERSPCEKFNSGIFEDIFLTECDKNSEVGDEDHIILL